MAKAKKYIIIENMELIKRWARDGLTHKQIATNLKIGKTTFEKYKRELPELSEALKSNVDLLMCEVENALTKRAKGYDYEETKTYIKTQDGKKVQYQEITKKHVPANVAAAAIILKNKDRTPDGKVKWSDNPGKYELDKEMAELKKELEELKLF
jgi:hypothetical protein